MMQTRSRLHALSQAARRHARDRGHGFGARACRVRPARCHDGGRHPRLDRTARPGLRGLPLRRLVALRRVDQLGPVALRPGGAADAGPRHQVDHRPRQQQAMDHRAAQGREVPRRLRSVTPIWWCGTSSAWSTTRRRASTPSTTPATACARSTSNAPRRSMTARVAIFTKTPDSLLPYNLSVWYMISKCAVEKANFDYRAVRQGAGGHGPLQVRQGRPARAPRAA